MSEERFDRIDERFDRIDGTLEQIGQILERQGETLERHGETLERHGETLERHDGTLDRLLTIAMDHGRDLSDIKKDMRQMRSSLDGMSEAFVEHLGWHLGKAG